MRYLTVGSYSMSESLMHGPDREKIPLSALYGMWLTSRLKCHRIFHPRFCEREFNWNSTPTMTFVGHP